jgi:hypothetical protein
MADATRLAEVTAAIARSEIVRRPSPGRAPRLPDGFDGVDVAILEWIAAEGRHAGRRLLPS